MPGAFAPIASSSNVSSQKFIGESRILGPKWSHLPTLTVGLLGVQIFWSVEMSYASPYLLSLGLSKSSMAMVFLAGPLAGLIMQPIIGILADNTTSKFGRRRPWMLTGTVVTVFAMLLLGYTRAFAALFTGWDNPSNDRWTVVLAVVAIYLVDFSINAVMAVDRALVVDTLPGEKQAGGTAWAARMLGVGGVMGFFVGSVKLTGVGLFGWFGTTQLQILSVLVSVLLVAGHGLMCVCVKEKVLVRNEREEGLGGKKENPVVGEVRKMWNTVTTLPSTIRLIFAVQFFAQMAWFPLMFYGTLYISEAYKRSTPIPASAGVAEMEARDAEGARLGSRALFLSAVLSLICTLVLPAFVTNKSRTGRSIIPPRFKSSLPGLWALGNLLLALCIFAASFASTSLFVSTSLFALIGAASAMGSWAPFALLGQAIVGSDDSNPLDEIHMAGTSALGRSDGDEREGLIVSEDRAEDEEKYVRHSEKITGELSAKAGAILGLHNVFIVIPQFIISGLSAIIFAIFDTPPEAAAAEAIRSERSEHSNSLVYVYRVGGLSAFVAFVFCWKLSRHLQKMG